ncbi:hypothetical protein B0A48_10997 [Cryoendolithus antarcticus]|uniref:PLD phosphodiesterase domain-containing protein n=1 Tax=Cryoendolithus antarcticus TaxID=1507870 RepID=A0A1V8SYY7_9PEZI|nr:hypothetical protein B0A48_10997 [Cryoendolithus antarcticus]
MPQHDLMTDFLRASSVLATVESQRSDRPNYWTTDPSSLLTDCVPGRLDLGTGEDLYASILPAIEAAQYEVILVTCFWARSRTLNRLNDSLRKLSASAIARKSKVAVRICFSSSSLWQKLVHTTSLEGFVVPPSRWPSQLGLPAESELRGLNLEIKSIFVLPFSVMHPKFIVVDRQVAFLPSCNVSWEDWFEGCIELRGSIVAQFVRFWQAFWAEDRSKEYFLPRNVSNETDQTQALFLPSPHHRNLRFSFPWQAAAPPPRTPLNVFLLTALANAKRSIFMQTPNLTAQPVIAALLVALDRGVDVRILTSERLMRLEQIVTAGTTTARCVQQLIADYKGADRGHDGERDLEAGPLLRVGRLSISYYTPRSAADAKVNEPVQSHLKLNVIDDEVVVLGSGNMDRASWYTSQELGVAFFSEDFASRVTEDLQIAMTGRENLIFDSQC